MVRRGHAGDEVVVGQPRQIDVGAHDAHSVDDGIVGCFRGVQAEDDDLVAGADEGPGQTLDVSRDAADDERRVLPRQHQHTHGRRP